MIKTENKQKLTKYKQPTHIFYFRQFVFSGELVGIVLLAPLTLPLLTVHLDVVYQVLNFQRFLPTRFACIHARIRGVRVRVLRKNK